MGLPFKVTVCPIDLHDLTVSCPRLRHAHNLLCYLEEDPRLGAWFSPFSFWSTCVQKFKVSSWALLSPLSRSVLGQHFSRNVPQNCVAWPNESGNFCTLEILKAFYHIKGSEKSFIRKPIWLCFTQCYKNLCDHRIIFSITLLE